jgi:hypothetical protein
MKERKERKRRKKEGEKKKNLYFPTFLFIYTCYIGVVDNTLTYNSYLFVPGHCKR